MALKLIFFQNITSMAYHNYQLSQPYNEKVHSLNVMKKRLPKLAVKNYNTVRLLDYLEERQKLREQPSYMFAKHSTTPWFQNDFYSSNYKFHLTITFKLIICFNSFNITRKWPAEFSKEWAGSSYQWPSWNHRRKSTAEKKDEKEFARYKSGFNTKVTWVQEISHNSNAWLW